MRLHVLHTHVLKPKGVKTIRTCSRSYTFYKVVSIQVEMLKHVSTQQSHEGGWDLITINRQWFVSLNIKVIECRDNLKRHEQG